MPDASPLSPKTISIPSDGRYFRNAGEADEWLDFECGPEEREQAFYAENDRYEEWQGWQRAWVAADV